MLTFIIGMMVGGIVGFSAFCLLTVGKDSDRYTEPEKYNLLEKSQATTVTNTFTDDSRRRQGTANAKQNLYGSDRT